MRLFRKILWPFSLGYHLVTCIRNLCYDYGLFKSTSYNFPIICVGNLSVGGTGKTPMIEYLIRLLQHNHKVATLSRGYGRKTKGYRKAGIQDSAVTLGDEPFQFYKKYPKVTVAVSESRVEGVDSLIADGFTPEVILLDDAFQHRSIKAGFNIVLTAYDDPYFKDLILPAGNLRESGKGVSRADIIVVTKCPDDLSEKKKAYFLEKIRPAPSQKVFFSSVVYDRYVYGRDSEMELASVADKELVVVTGIAKPEPMLSFFKNEEIRFQHLKFPDHHNFSPKDIQQIKNVAKDRLIVTTEKDFTRLSPLLPDVKLYFLPIKMGFLTSEEDFKKVILDFISIKKT